MWKSRAGYAAENPGHWPSELHGKGEARTALLKGPKPACGNPRLSLWHETQTNRLCLIWRTAVYGPVRTVVWEGRSREAPPIPIGSPSDPPAIAVAGAAPDISMDRNGDSVRCRPMSFPKST